MATPGDLIAAVAAALDISEQTVFQHDRELVKAGLRRTGGRGRSSIKVTAEDAANLIISIVGAPAFGPSVKCSAATVQQYVRLPAWKDSVFLSHGRWERSMPQLPFAHTFGAALSEIVRSFANGSFNRAVDIWPELKVVKTQEMPDQFDPDFPIGGYDPGMIEVDVTLDCPPASARIEIAGHTSFPFNRIEERLEYRPSLRRNKVIIRTPVLQTRRFSDDVLRKVASIFSETTQA